MKKILFLFVALIMSVASAMAENITSLSQAQADAYYTIHCGRGYLTVKNDYSRLYGSKEGSAAASTVFDAEDKNFQFQFVKNGDNYYLYNVGAEKYSKNDGTLVADITEAAAISFRTWSNNTVQPYWDDTHNLNLGGDNQLAIGEWKTQDAGDQFEITKLEIADFTVSVAGGIVGGGISYKGNNYTEGQTFQAATANTANFQAIAVTGYDGEVSVSGNVATVTYSEHVDPVLGETDIDFNKAYYIYTDARGGITIADENSTRLYGTEEVSPQQTVSKTDVRQQFAFIKYNEKLYLYSVGAQKFVNSNGGTTGKLDDEPINTIGFANPGDGTVRLLFTDVADQNFNLGGSKQMEICYWSAKDAGNKFKIYPVADFNPDPIIAALASTVRVDVTYLVKNVKGEDVAVVVENVKAGEEAAVPVTNGYFTGAITESDLVISETNNTFHVTGTWEFPFAEDKYYTMHSKANANNYVCNGTNAWYNNSVTVAENNNVWEFTHVAGTLDLFTVKNYGHNKYAVLSGSGRNACTFAAEPTVWTEGTGATSYFRVVKQDGGFNLQHPGDAETNVGSHVDNKFGSWKASGSPTNAASINVIEETTPVAPAEKANVTYNYVVDGKPINYTTSSEQVVGQAPAAPASYDFATVTSNAEELTVAGDGSTVVTVQVTQELPFGLGDGSDQFLHRGFLHVHSNQGRYMYFDYDDEAEAMMVYDTENYETGSGLNKKLTMDFPSSASTCKWHITGNVVEGFKLYNDTYEFVLAATAPQATMLSVDDPANGENPGTAFVLKRSTAGVGEFNFKRGFCLYAPERSQYLNAQTKMMYWTAADAGSTFEFEESYDVTIGEAGLATLYYHTPLSLDNVEGLTAYTLTLEGDYLVANETSTIPAYTGVVLAGEAKTYTLPVAFENVPGMGALTGSYTEKATPANCYVLSKDGNDACFAKYTGAKVGEFKAYFIGETANSESNYRISFGELTSIISAAQQNGGQAIYDLQGRRVVSAKGISIVNGKKVIK